jgi:hypothetical protein
MTFPNRSHRLLLRGSINSLSRTHCLARAESKAVDPQNCVTGFWPVSGRIIGVTAEDVKPYLLALSRAFLKYQIS